MNWVSSAPEDVLLQRAKQSHIMDKFEKVLLRDSAHYSIITILTTTTTTKSELSPIYRRYPPP